MPRLMSRPVFAIAVIALLGLLALPLRAIAQEATTTPSTGGLQIGPTASPTTAASGATPSTGGLVIGPTPTPTPKTGVHGNAYTSPTYGFTLSWSSRWHVVQQSSKSGVDQLTLSDGTASVVLATTTAFDGDVSRCDTAMIAKLAATSVVTDVKPATDPQGKPLTGSSATRAWSVQIYTKSGTSMTRYIDCRVLVPHRANLVITADIALDKFNGESPQLLALLDKLALAPTAATPVASPVTTTVPATETAVPVPPSQVIPTREVQPTSEATAVATTGPLSTPVFPVQTTPTPGALPTQPVGQARVQPTGTEDLSALGVHGNTYKSPNYGYTLSWDSSWTVSDANSSRGGQSGIGFDQLTLLDAASAMTITGSEDFNGNSQQCVTGVGQALQQGQSGETISNFKVASGSDGKPLQGGTATDAWAVFTYTRAQSGQSQAVANYVECRTLVSGKAVLVIVQDVAQSDYNSELGPRQKLLATLKIPSQPAAATTPEATVPIGQ